MVNSALELMLKEIREQTELLVSGVADLEQQIDKILEVPDWVRPEKIYIVGCGDSFYAGLACQQVFARYTGVETQVWQALEFSRYIYSSVNPRSVVLAVSNSGEVARTVECVVRANRQGARTIGITRNTRSRLAEQSKSVVEVKIPSVVGVLPGTRSYLGSLVALTAFALTLGERLGAITPTEKHELKAYLKDLAAPMRATIEANYITIGEYIHSEEVDIYHILGSGPNYGTAQFGTMKLLEAAGFVSIPQGIEEWAHTQYFVTRPGTHVIVLAPKGCSHDRSLEIMPAVKTVGGKVIAVAEEDDEEVKQHADFVWGITGIRNIREEFSPFLYSVPLELLAYHIAVKYNTVPLDFEGKPWKREENFRQIFHSRIVE
ncbi:SIS domain-containing protein [Moorellaceae bacterium AZ2]